MGMQNFFSPRQNYCQSTSSAKGCDGQEEFVKDSCWSRSAVLYVTTVDMAYFMTAFQQIQYC